MSAKKRVSLIAGMKAAKDQAAAHGAGVPDREELKAPAPKAKGPDKERWMTTAIHIRRDQWELLRDVAYKRANRDGGRQSVSTIIRDLIDQAEKELRGEP